MFIPRRVNGQPLGLQADSQSIIERQYIISLRLTLRLLRGPPRIRHPARLSIITNNCPCRNMSATIFSILLFVIIVSLGCASENLDEVRASKPLRTTTFETPYDTLAACVKHRLEKEVWIFGEPSVHWKREKGRELIRVYEIYSRTMLFDVTFEATQTDRTIVEYRQGLEGYGIQSRTWGIIVSCNRENLAPIDKPNH